MKTNYHTHTLRCQHASGSELDYVLAAISKGLSELGFSDHAPYIDNRFGLRMPYHELNDYIHEVHHLKKCYEDQIKIYCGLEIEYDPNQLNYYQNLKQQGIEYLVLGQHIYFKDEYINIYFLEKEHDTSSFIDYAYSLKEAMHTQLFDIIAHPDVIFINHFAWDENCDQACDIIIEAAQETNTILELNANGFRRGIHPYPDGNRYMYPHDKFWEKVSKTNIKVIINSDCHSPDAVYDEANEMAFEYAKRFQLNLISSIQVEENL